MSRHAQSSAEGRNQHERVRLDAARFQRFDERHGRGGRAHVSVLVNVEKYLVHRRAHPFGNRFENAQIRLVRHDDFHIINRHTSLRQDLDAGIAHAGDGLDENFLAVEIPARVARQRSDVGVDRAHAAHAQGLAGIGEAFQLLRDDAGLMFRGFKDARGGTVAKQNRHIAILPVHEFGNVFHADDQHLLCRARFDERGGGGHAVEKTGAGGIDVHCRRVVRAQFRLHAGSAVWRVLIKSGAAVEDEVEFFGFQAGARQCAFCRDIGHFLAGDMRDAPFLHAGAADDPLVVGRQESGEVRIGEDRGRETLAPSGERSEGHIGFHSVRAAGTKTNTTSHTKNRAVFLIFELQVRFDSVAISGQLMPWRVGDKPCLRLVPPC